MTRRAVSATTDTGVAARSILPTEHQEQVAFVRWFRAQYPKIVILAIPNGGARHIVAAKKLKAEGVVSGVADLYIPKIRLWVEMKRQKGGALSDSQKEFRNYVIKECGDSWLLANGWEHGRGLILAMQRNGAFIRPVS